MTFAPIMVYHPKTAAVTVRGSKHTRDDAVFTNENLGNHS